MTQIGSIQEKICQLENDYSACITVQSLLAMRKEWTSYHVVRDLMDAIDAEIDNLNTMIHQRD